MTFVEIKTTKAICLNVIYYLYEHTQILVLKKFNIITCICNLCFKKENKENVRNKCSVYFIICAAAMFIVFIA